MYNCPEDFNDGLAIDYRVEGLDTSSTFAEIRRSRVDICLVDGWHTYECAASDLRQAYESLADGGVLIVHDCLPPSPEIAAPAYVPGAWSGVSYKAYVDFILDNNAEYCTVDTDFGCGIVAKGFDILTKGKRFSRPRRSIVKEWRLCSSYDENFNFLHSHKAELLRTISVDDFASYFALKRSTRKRLQAYLDFFSFGRSRVSPS